MLTETQYFGTVLRPHTRIALHRGDSLLALAYVELHRSVQMESNYANHKRGQVPYVKTFVKLLPCENLRLILAATVSPLLVRIL